MRASVSIAARKSASGVSRQSGAQMHSYSVFTLGVVYVDAPAGGCVGKGAAVAGLTAHLGVEGGAVENYLIKFAVFLFYLAVAEYAAFGLGKVIAYKLLLAIAHSDPVGGLHGGSIAGTRLLRFHLTVEALAVEGHAVLAQNQVGEVKREAVGIVECERPACR